MTPHTERIIAEFREKFSNVGWYPENKKRLEQFLSEKLEEAYERGLYDALSPTDRNLNTWSWEKNLKK